MGIDNKYGRVTCERGSIGEDEPVVVFRARDAVLLEVLAWYWGRCAAWGSPKKHLDLITDSFIQIREWQSQHPIDVRVPRSDDYEPK